MNPLSGDLTFVDASGWIALVNANDTLHQQSVRLFEQRLNDGRGFVSSSVVLLEVGNWLSPIPLRRLASGLMERIEHSSRVQVVELTPELYRKGWQLYRERPDKDWGVIDCISFTIMQERNIVEALTGDRHFQQAGFVALL
jgi:predicted nucleic acid-binding protein